MRLFISLEPDGVKRSPHGLAAHCKFLQVGFILQRRLLAVHCVGFAEGVNPNLSCERVVVEELWNRDCVSVLPGRAGQCEQERFQRDCLTKRPRGVAKRKLAKSICAAPHAVIVCLNLENCGLCRIQRSNHLKFAVQSCAEVGTEAAIRVLRPPLLDFHATQVVIARVESAGCREKE